MRIKNKYPDKIIFNKKFYLFRGVSVTAESYLLMLRNNLSLVANGDEHYSVGSNGAKRNESRRLMTNIIAR
jgi:hypothetical protein